MAVNVLNFTSHHLNVPGILANRTCLLFKMPGRLLQSSELTISTSEVVTVRQNSSVR